MKEFSVLDGLAIQSQHLEEWSAKLNIQCYADLLAYVVQENAKLFSNKDATGYDVVRGENLNTFIFNWKAK